MNYMLYLSEPGSRQFPNFCIGSNKISPSVSLKNCKRNYKLNRNEESFSKRRLEKQQCTVSANKKMRYLNNNAFSKLLLKKEKC